MVTVVRNAKSWWREHPRLGWMTVALLAVIMVVGGVLVALALGTIFNAAAVSTATVNTASTYTISGAKAAVNETISSFTVTFPANTDISQVTAADVTPSWQVESSITKSGNQLTVNFTTPVSLAKNQALSIAVANVINPSEPGSYSLSGSWAGSAPGTYGPLSYTISASATAVTAVTATPSTTAELTAAGYSVAFTTGAAGRLAGATADSGAPYGGANSIVITFPAGTTVPAAPSAADVTINGTAAQAVSVSGQVVTLYLASSQTIPASTAITVAFNSFFGLVNPAGGTYTLGVSTSAETTSATSGSYTIAAGTKLTVTQGSDTGRPTVRVYSARSTDKVVDELSLAATGGTMTLTQIVVTGLDTVSANLGTDVTSVKLYRDNGTTVGQLDAGDSLFGSASFSGTTATVAGSLAIAAGTTEKIWIVYTVGASAVDGDIVGSQVSVGGVTATGGAVTQTANIVSANTGQTVQVDAPTAGTPAVAVSAPASSALLSGTSATVSGTASDAGSGLASVQVQISRSSGGYWSGTDWTGTSATWLAATGTTSWTYAWALDAGQNGTTSPTYTIVSRATDNVGNIGTSASATGVKVDNVAPTISSASAVDATTADVVFSEALQSSSIAASDFTVSGLTVSTATLQADGKTVRLTTSTQTASQNYTVTCAAGNVLDVAGNANAVTSATFTGYAPVVVAPAITSASAVNATTVDVLWSKALQASSIVASDFTISGLTVSAAVLQADGKTVRLTTSVQTSGQSYTVSCGAGNVLDTSGTANALSSVTFAGYTFADTTPPTVPTNVTATAGVAPSAVATITWTASTDNIGVAGYRIFRSVYAAGPFEAIGTSASSTFVDTTGVPGQTYYYKVAAFDAAGNESAPSAATGPVEALWRQAPHASYSSSTKLCRLCHTPHDAATAKYVFRDTGAATPGELAVCYACHDGTSASDNIKNGATNSFALSSGHTLEATDPATNLTNACSSCHNPHRDYQSVKMIPASTVNSATVDPAKPNTLCLACHNGTNDWYKGTYPNAASPTFDATGYPTLGTFPTTSSPSPTVAYTDGAYNAHVSIPTSITVDRTRQAGDCLYCHSSHRSATPYDSLVATFQPAAVTDPAAATYGDYATLCFQCHGTASGGYFTTPFNSAAGNPVVDIQQFVMAKGTRSGHRIKTAGGTYAVGAPLPCYECHNPHGSTRTNAHLFSDSLGGSLETTTPAGVRAFCFTCHTTADTAAGWNSSTSSLSAAAAAGKKVAGLARDAAVGANVLRLPSVSGHNSTDTQSCYQCHGNDYGAGGSNVHNPTGGVSAGGTDCYSCHSAYQTYMEDGTGTKQGGTTERVSVYHHVMGSATNDGDKAFAAGAYPASTADVYCLSCHVDHDKFNSAKASNLRPDVTATNPAGAATDYSSATDTGVCTSCHATSLAKDTTNQKTDGSSATPKIVPGAGASQFGASAHDYYATSTFGAGNTFSANCSKCHTDEQTKSFQDSTNKFGTHYGTERHLLSALGGTLTDPLSETHCYGCHTGATAGNDYYGAKAMTQLARSTQAQFALTGSKHPVVASGGNSVECESCHNAHVVTSTTGKVTDPANTYNVIAYSTVADKSAFCLKCHSAAASLPAYTVSGTAYVPSTVTIASADQTLMNKSTNSARGHWSASGSISSSEVVACGQCHDNHGSNVVKLLGQYNAATGVNEIANPSTGASSTITADNNSVCLACHALASTGYPAATRDASGYPTDGTWPGSAVYNTAYSSTAHTGSMHTVSTAVWPGKTYAAGDCKNCHDVHGTANTYDELRTENASGVSGTFSFSSTNFGVCFNCHDSSGPASAASNIYQFFPTSAGGGATQTSSTRFGHKTLSAGTLPAGSALPCYDCHNPHGSASAYGLTVVTQTSSTATITVGDVANEIKMSPTEQATAANVRNFCFACHTTADTSAGFNGTAMAVVSAGAKVEGIDRTVYSATGAHLRLPAVSGHNAADAQSCYGCHGNDYSSATANNVHNPGPGGSNGGMNCLNCHGSTSSERYDKMVNDTTTYHHVLDSTTPGNAPGTGTYPNSTNLMECVSCHTDHNYFNANKASNLRTAITNTSGASNTNTDFITGGTPSYGVCLSCHTSAQTKSTSQKTTGASSQTLAMNAANYDASAHDYAVPTTYGDSTTFNANCSKCHDDEQDALKTFQTGSYKFGTHYSVEARIANALGAALAGTSSSTEENLCYKCHTGGTAGPDGYGTGSMSANARSIYTVFNDATKTYKHPIAGTAGVHKSDEGAAAGWNPAASRHVECEDCHNPHEATTGTTPWPSNQARRGSTPPAIAGATKGVWGVNITGAAADGTWAGSGTSGAPTAPTYSRVSSSSYQWQLCLKCHSSWAFTTTPPTVSLNLQNQTGGKQTDVGADFNPMQLSYHPIFKQGLNQPGTTLNPAWSSNVERKWIDLNNNGVNDGVTETNSNGLSNTFTDGWVTTSIVVCTDCHNNSDSTGPSGPHASANKWILSGVDVNVKSTLQDGTTVTNSAYASANFCINCHRVDVYGTNGKTGINATSALLSRMDHNQMSSSCYNLATFASAALTWSSCLHCHGGRKDASSYNNPANTVVQNGAIHGTSLTYHPSAATYTGAANYMGQRFLNGASWSQHYVDKGGTTVGCYNFSSRSAPLVDNYSACNKHTPSEYAALQYAY